MEKKNDKAKAWLKREMRPYRGSVVFLTVLTVISVVSSLAFDFLVRYLINGAADGDKKRVFLFAAVLLGVIAFGVSIQTVKAYLSEKYRAKITVGLRHRLFGGILKAEYPEIEKYHSGDLLNRLTSDVSEVAVDSVSILPAVFGMIVQCVGAVSALLYLDPLFTAVFTLGGALCGGVFALFRKKVKEYHKGMHEADGKSRSFMQEGIVSMITLKAYGSEEKTSEKARAVLNEYYGKRMKKNRLQTGVNALFSLLSNAGMIFAVIWCSVSIMRTGSGDFGSILSVVLLVGQLQHPFAAFSAILPVYYTRAASAERLAETDLLSHEDERRFDEKKLYEEMQSIRFENLSFTYGRAPVLTNVNAEVKKGDIVCITGKSGSGKSTLFKLLLSIYAPTDGKISIVGKKETPVSVQTRTLFSYVPQGNFLFSGTIKENLTFFAEGEVSEEKIKDALVCAQADFVYELPEGLSTSLKEQGGGLSEGQLQRLAIARALLSDRPVLLLDEATSALDEKTEKQVLQNIKNRKGQTCLIVTHRPAALQVADGVLHVEGGALEETAKK